MTTLREYLEAIRNRNDEFLTPKRNGPDYQDAVAALEILDDAEILGREDRSDSWCVLLPDPKVDE